MTKQEKQQLSRIKALAAAFRHEVEHRGPNATVAIDHRSRPTKKTTRRFCPQDKTSPEGSIISAHKGWLRVIYTAQELLDYFTQAFPDL